MTARKYISRVFGGWQVRIKNPVAGYIAQWFSDKDFDGKSKALQAAKKYRDDALKTLNLPLNDGRVTGPRVKSRRTSTGIIGVTLLGARWKGHFYDKAQDKQLNKQFSVEKYGECEAFEMACKYRFEQCGTLQVYRGHNFPCKIPVPFEYVD